MKKKIAVFILLTLIIASFGFIIYKPPPIRVKIGYIPAASYGLIWIAYEKGYFNYEGLIVELKEYPSTVQLAMALYNKEIDGAPLTSVAVAAFIRRIDFVIVAGNSLDGTALVSNRNFSRLEELSGKAIGTVQYVPGDFIFKNVFSQRNLNVTLKEYLTPADALQALEGGYIEASLLWEPYVSLAEYRNLSIAFWDKQVNPKEYPCCLQVFLNSFIQSHPEAITKFIRALIKAEKLAYEKPNEAFPLIKKYLPTLPPEIVYKSIFYIDPTINRPRNPISAYVDRDSLISFFSLLVPSIISHYDYSLLISKINLSYYEKAITSLRAEGFSLPNKYLR
ncbi:MAG: ABC transporter substrate-binding protein [Candidatus Methanomethyliaceae archaeon]|nr:ABC transporter substrate-binding protein [Candidatus Methanomethyliaceae archaeon]MCX8169709.1 ABC transporter substrate-binding protein [Candidatus Methanomethyliaceae archaeon]MDW7971392.1 ABC transporter substrate-binding protein [Nitrososphaerota archaeon]